MFFTASFSTSNLVALHADTGSLSCVLNLTVNVPALNLTDGTFKVRCVGAACDKRLQGVLLDNCDIMVGYVIDVM
jgi:hypothetical protein